MVWMKKERDTSLNYMRLADKNDCKKRVPKGYVPILVGDDTAGEKEKRFLIPVKFLKEPFMAALLEQAIEQFGYQQGVLRVPCDVYCFQHTIDLISGCR